jgi:hypothetical protein
MTGDFLEGIQRWLETSGHAFELRVARSFREGRARPVDVSFSYTDASTGALREGDVLAQFGWTSLMNTPASIEVVTECKSGRDHPWIAFYDRRIARGSALEDWTYFAHGPFTGVTQPLDDLWVGRPPFDALQIASHLVAAHSKDSHNPAGDAVRQVLSAAEARRRWYIERQNQDRRGCVIVPVVVTGARLVSCELDASGEMQLEEVSSAVVSGPRSGKSARVFILTEDAVKTFARNLSELAGDAHTLARNG